MSSFGFHCPNFVLTMTDTQATNVVGAYGHPVGASHAQHRSAGGGGDYFRACLYDVSTVCTPNARASLFTGIYPLLSAGAWTTCSLGDNVKTMGQRFADAGYATAYGQVAPRWPRLLWHRAMPAWVGSYLLV